MIVYQCPRCDYTTNKKYDIENHYNRKFPCEVTEKDIPIEECKLNLKKFIREFIKVDKEEYEQLVRENKKLKESLNKEIKKNFREKEKILKEEDRTKRKLKEALNKYTELIFREKEKILKEETIEELKSLEDLPEIDMDEYPNYVNKHRIYKNGKRAKYSRTKAFRSSCYLSSLEFKKKNLDKKCSLCNSITNLQVDHFNNPFSKILDDFLEKYNINFHLIEVYKYRFNRKGQYKLPNKIIYNNKQINEIWKEYHDSNCEYRILCKTCNTYMSSYGYSYKYAIDYSEDYFVKKEKYYEDNKEKIKENSRKYKEDKKNNYIEIRSKERLELLKKQYS
jgi:hypothetical protein